MQEQVGPVQGDNNWDIFNPSESTVRELGARKGEHGGHIVTLYREGARWVSSYTTVHFDPQGDPRWFISMVGVEAARFFGFRIIDNERVEVPDQAEFVGALDAINAVLKLSGDQIPITFYTTLDNANVKAAEYVQRFRDEGGIPLAHSGNHLIHDLSFHTAAIFLPSEAVRLKRKEAEFLEAFLDYLKPKYARDEERAKALRYYTLALRLEETSSIDNGTGILAPIIVAFLNSNRTDRDWPDRVAIAIKYMISGGMPPKQRLDVLLQALGKTSRLTHQTFGRLIDYEKLELHQVTLPAEELRVHLQTFARIFDPDARMTVEWQSLRGSPAIDKLCLEISRRRALIRDIALKLLPTLGELPPPIPLPDWPAEPPPKRSWWQRLKSKFTAR